MRIIIFDKSLLTASSSLEVKMNFMDHLYGIMAITKKGKARAAAEDFTIHRMTRPNSCRMVNRCILQVFIFFT